MKLHKCLIVLLLLSCTGCASIISGTSQNLAVTTNPTGARCDLTRQGMIIGAVSESPGAVMVDKTKHDISVVCKKNGYGDGQAHLDSGVDGMVYWNILLGGLIGWGIDSAAGADNKYPEVVNVNLVPQVANSTTQSTMTVAQLSPRVVEPDKFVSKSKVEKSSKIETRLKNLEDLRNKNLITEEEHKKAKDKVLSDL